MLRGWRYQGRKIRYSSKARHNFFRLHIPRYLRFDKVGGLLIFPRTKMHYCRWYWCISPWRFSSKVQSFRSLDERGKETSKAKVPSNPKDHSRIWLPVLGDLLCLHHGSSRRSGWIPRSIKVSLRRETVHSSHSVNSGNLLWLETWVWIDESRPFGECDH